jgi:hypothetical protein
MVKNIYSFHLPLTLVCTQIGGLGGPVVHLGIDIDIDRVLVIPGRGQALVTYALQIGGLCAVSRMAIT